LTKKIFCVIICL